MRRPLLLALAAVSALALVVATGGFSAATMDRGISVPVADDPENGLIGIHGDDRITVEYGSNQVGNARGAVTLFTVKNNLGRPITVEVDVSPDGETPPDLHDARIEQTRGGYGDDMLGPGDSADVLADITCANQAPETWTVTITVTDGGMTGKIHHEVTVICEHDPRTTTVPGDNGSGGEEDGNDTGTGVETEQTAEEKHTPGEERGPDT